MSFLLISCRHANKPGSEKTTLNEFSIRYQKAYDRLVSRNLQPVFTKEFILADVALDPAYPRRFSDFSGDLSGRYIEVMSLAARDDQEKYLKDLVTAEISCQKPDGRFGDASLNFQQPDITAEHMALLWGNGRLLVGLMAYYLRTRDVQVLEAAKKLGDFYLTTYAYCSKKEVVDRLTDLGANGIICFTQYIEGMAELYRVTGDARYLDVCRKVYPLLPPRGNQHAHGYLTTLRGVLDLYAITGDTACLNFVANRYESLVHSNDLTIFGSVMEFFGNSGSRDEGCAVADFIRLSLGLYEINGDQSCLEHAENALYNSLYFNQYETGDFGHHELLPAPEERDESQTSPGRIKALTGASAYYRMAAWWCCTMHGLRCLVDVQDKMIRFRNGRAYLDLFLETSYHKNGLALTVNRESDPQASFVFNIRLDSIRDREIYIRHPSWASEVRISVNGNPARVNPDTDYIEINDHLKAGDRITIELDPVRRFVDARGMTLSPVPDEFSGYYYCGPYLMGIDDNSDPLFMAEPNNNIVFLNTIRNNPAENMPGFEETFCQAADYRHSGFPSRLETLMRPIKDIAYEKTPMLAFRFNFEKQDSLK